MFVWSVLVVQVVILVVHVVLVALVVLVMLTVRVVLLVLIFLAVLVVYVVLVVHAVFVLPIVCYVHIDIDVLDEHSQNLPKLKTLDPSPCIEVWDYNLQLSVQYDSTDV